MKVGVATGVASERLLSKSFRDWRKRRPDSLLTNLGVYGVVHGMTFRVHKVDTRVFYNMHFFTVKEFMDWLKKQRGKASSAHYNNKLWIWKGDLEMQVVSATDSELDELFYMTRRF